MTISVVVALVAALWIGYRIVSKFRCEQRRINRLLDDFDRDRGADTGHSEEGRGTAA